MQTVALKGTKFLRKMEVATMDLLKGYVKHNGKRIAVERYGVGERWYQQGLPIAKVDTMYKEGKYL